MLAQLVCLALSLVANPVVYVACLAPLPAVELLALACPVCPLPLWSRLRL